MNHLYNDRQLINAIYKAMPELWTCSTRDTLIPCMPFCGIGSEANLLT